MRASTRFPQRLLQHKYWLVAPLAVVSGGRGPSPVQVGADLEPVGKEVGQLDVPIQAAPVEDHALVTVDRDAHQGQAAWLQYAPRSGIRTR